MTLNAGGKTGRRMQVRVPTNYNASKAAFLLVTFHGAGGTLEGDLGVPQAASSDGAFVINADPAGLTGVNGRSDTGWEEHCDGYDVAFFDAIVDYVAKNYCIDRKKIFVAGFSWGGDMSNALACCRGNVIRGAIPMSGGLGPDVNPVCQSNRPGMLQTYSNNDAYSQAAFAKVREWYRLDDGCSATLTQGSPTQCQEYQGCAADHTSITCMFPGNGHNEPPGSGTLIWNFLKRFQ